MNPLFLGLDLSTQQLKAVLIQDDCSIVHESAVHFDRDLPQYGTVNGAIKGPDGEVTSPVAMWLDALDLLMARMKQAGVDFASIAAISGAGQVCRSLLFGGSQLTIGMFIATWFGLLVVRSRECACFARPNGTIDPIISESVLYPQSPDLAGFFNDARVPRARGGCGWPTSARRY